MSLSYSHERNVLYRTWYAMIQRCENKASTSYALYGGRGVKVHKKWKKDFVSFAKHVGPRPSREHSLDRHPDPNGDYVPGNVRWATRTEQNRNRRTTKLNESIVRSIRTRITNGETRGSLAREYKVDPSTIRQISVGRIWKDQGMTKKKEKEINGNGHKLGRPKVLPPELSKRYQIRCSPKDVEAWESRAAQLGYPGASSWIRKVLNDALKQPAR